MFSRLFDRGMARQLRRIGTVGLMSLAFLLSLGSYIVYTNTKQPLGPKPETVTWLIGGNVGVLVILAIVVGRRVIRLWRSLRRGSAGSKLQTRVVLTFSLVTIIPTVMISIFSAVLFQYGIKSWFDKRVETALQGSVIVAERYLEEHKATLRADALAMSGDLSRELDTAVLNPPIFLNILNEQVALRDLNEAVVLQQRHVIARSHLSFSLIFETVPEDVLVAARRGEVPIIDEGDRIMAVSLIDARSDSFLLLTRLVDAQALAYTDKTDGAVQQYERLQSQIVRLQYQFIFVYALVVLLLLLSVLWYGMLFATRLVVPLTRLIHATERVRAGDFSLKIEAGKGDDELTTLIRRFNRMTAQLRAQREDITQVNRLLDERRRFSETVLEGVSAGIVALDAEQRVRLLNRTACEYLHLNELATYEGVSLIDLMPMLAGLLEQARNDPRAMQTEDVTLAQENRLLTLHTRISAEMQGPQIAGYIVTFDDISPLVSAQRRAAWSDVARRVAHEIKNPLTPIQLSAERLRKKFAPEKPEDRETFNRYIDTILRHLRDIGLMVEEFVSFSRMPTPLPKRELLLPLLQKAAFSSETASSVPVTVETIDPNLSLICDESQMNQVLTNLLKNAVEGIERMTYATVESPHIWIDVTLGDEALVIFIKDNGVGLPVDQIDKLTEPYVTTREKGTGLGLAIVKKIVEDHKGRLTLSNRPEGGACVCLSFPIEMEGQTGN